MFCTYLTIYYGDKLPKRYIGSSTVQRVLGGYNGSIKSKKYKSIYENEQRKNKNLFKTRILSIHKTHEEALEFEYKLHDKYEVSKSPLYMNMAKASKGGYFGNGASGKDHPMYNKTLSAESKNKISESVKKAYLEKRLESPFKNRNVSGQNNPFYGKSHSENAKAKMSKPKKFVPKWPCPHCNKLYDAGNLKQHMLRNGYSVEDVEKCKMNGK